MRMARITRDEQPRPVPTRRVGDLPPVQPTRQAYVGDQHIDARVRAQPGFVVKNGSSACARVVSSIPTPVSVTEIST